ncbi:MAG: thioredoxin-dependent thiol peroxidase [Micrococcales bacterium]|nr:thioredoxin-dependent thiol peroxidase [Micrococcales bacterium]
MARLDVGDLAPDFTLQNQDGEDVTLSTLRGSDVIVYFYPAAGTPGCTRQARDFRDSLGSLVDHGYQVLGVSPDTVSKLAAFTALENLTYPLLADPEHQVMEHWGAWGEKNVYGTKTVGVIRSTVVVGADGKVSLARYNVKATGHVAMLRKALGID